MLELGAETLVLTHDMMVEGVHFLSGQDPADVAWKLVAVNVSDLASKGARPLGVLLGYALDEHDARFVEGLRGALAHYGAALLGGDTVRAPQGARTLALTAIGQATCRPVPSRTGCRPGDALYVTGPLGAAMLGLEALRTGTGDSLAYRRPEARLSEGIALAAHVTAMMDISDGLLLDALRMARSSGVTLEIDSAAVPVAVPESRRAQALRWGDDYELLLSAPEGVEFPVRVHRIGTVGQASGAELVLDGAALDPSADLGYRH